MRVSLAKQLMDSLPEQNSVVVWSGVGAHLCNKHLCHSGHDDKKLTSWVSRETDNRATRLPVLLELGQNICP